MVVVFPGPNTRLLSIGNTTQLFCSRGSSTPTWVHSTTLPLSCHFFSTLSSILKSPHFLTPSLPLAHAGNQSWQGIDMPTSGTLGNYRPLLQDSPPLGRGINASPHSEAQLLVPRYPRLSPFSWSLPPGSSQAVGCVQPQCPHKFSGLRATKRVPYHLSWTLDSHWSKIISRPLVVALESPGLIPPRENIFGIIRHVQFLRNFLDCRSGQNRAYFSMSHLVTGWV